MSEPTTSRRIDKRNLITDAAVEVFAEKGFHLARISDIAQRAGIADGTIYLYFKNKEDLLLSIFEEKMDLLLSGLGETLADVEGPEERIRAFARFHFDQVRTNRSAAEVLQVRSSRLLQVGDHNRTYTVELACAAVDPSREAEAVSWLRTQLPRRRRVNLRPVGTRDGQLLARVTPIGEALDLSSGLVAESLAADSCSVEAA